MHLPIEEISATVSSFQKNLWYSSRRLCFCGLVMAMAWNRGEGRCNHGASNVSKTLSGFKPTINPKYAIPDFGF
jgi:hypothetical protein